MTRRIPVLASLLITATASYVQAQPYPTYAGAMPQGGMYSQAMPPGGGYGPMSQGMYPGMAPQGMPPQGMYPGPAPQGMYPGMMQQGGVNPGLIPQRMAYPETMGQNPGAMQAGYQVPAAPAPKKLPRGITSENGVLYYNGRPYAENNGAPCNPYQTVSYEANMDGQSMQGAPPGAMSQGGYGGDMQGYGEMQGADCGCGQGCENGGCGDGHGGWCSLAHLCGHGGPFTGKYGYMWTAGVDALAFNRDAGTNRVLVQNTDTLAPIFNSNQFSFDFTAGARAHINLMGPSGIQYQAVYMKLATLVANADVIGDNNLQIPFPLAADTVDFFGANEMLFHYASQIQGGEINMIYPFGNFQLLGGYRYLAIDESLRLTSIDVADAGTSDFTTNCFNQMHGGQIGILGQWELFGLLNFDFDAKFGIFDDIVSQHQVLRDFDNTVVLRDTSGHESSVAYVTELGMMAVLPLGASFNIHCGYNVFFIDRVALAPDQLDFTDNLSSGTQVHQKGDIIVQGVVLGVDARW